MNPEEGVSQVSYGIAGAFELGQSLQGVIL